MEILSLKKYHKQAAVVDKKNSSQNSPVLSNKLPKGTFAETSTGAIKMDREFLEFFINDIPLTELLDKFYNQKGSVLDNSVGVLGSTTNLPAEIVKLKQLLSKNISDRDIRNAFPLSWTDHEFESYLDDYREELSEPEILIYCCGECGDYKCGGVSILITKTVHSVLWTFTEPDKTLSFEFDKYLYLETFEKRIKYLQSKVAKN